MPVFLKDFIALLSIVGFTGGILHVDGHGSRNSREACGLKRAAVGPAIPVREFETNERPRLHPPARPFGLFPPRRGAAAPQKFLDLAKYDKQPALGIADTNNLFGALEFSEKAAGKGDPAASRMRTSSSTSAATRPGRHERRDFGKGGVVLMAPRCRRVLPICRGSSAGRLPRRPVGQCGGEDRLAQRRRRIEGIVCLSGGPRGRYRSASSPTAWKAVAAERLDMLHEAFGDRFYVELQRHGRHQEAIQRSPSSSTTPTVAASRWLRPTSRFSPAPFDFEAHDALLAIAGSTVLAQTERRKLTAEHYFKSRKEMQELFADLPEALNSTIEIARRANIRPKTRGPSCPVSPPSPAKVNRRAWQPKPRRCGLRRAPGLPAP